MDLTHDNWKKVEENLNSFFGTVSELCQSILSLSYSYLPQYLRACFLYIGGFPEDEEINVSKLITQWIAEQFVKARSNKRLEVVAEEYLEELIDRSLILTGKQRANGRMKTCKIHDLLQQLCLSEAPTENVVHVMNGNVLEAIDDQRRMILLSEVEEKHDYRMQHSSGIIRNFISMRVDFQVQMCSIVSQFKLLKVVEKRIRNVVYRVEDRIDSSLRSIIVADREVKRQKAGKSFYEELLKVEQQVYFLNKEVMLIEFNKHGSKSAELARISSSLEKSTIEENTIVGMEDDLNTILDRLISQTDELTVIPIFGMGDIGKTTLVRKVYDDSYIRSRFDKQAWVTISQEYNERQMLLELV
ncbi:hypothetical protein KY289_007596 [Solanum tuberosum]|nr:hypothetical protein KY289_007596 [Solanum tuberosum]